MPEKLKNNFVDRGKQSWRILRAIQRERRAMTATEVGQYLSGNAAQNNKSGGSRLAELARFGLLWRTSKRRGVPETPFALTLKGRDLMSQPELVAKTELGRMRAAYADEEAVRARTLAPLRAKEREEERRIEAVFQRWRFPWEG